ncbi:MAG: glycoside hydrolase family 2 TIM barrel-domain containing protein, partial [Archaeoglobaceae archaeon]
MRIKLREGWLFSANDGECFKEVSIPHCFQLSKETYPNPPYNKGVYKRVLKELKGKSKKKVILRFHGVDFYSKVLVNKKLVAEHINGYDLFEMDITRYLNFNGEDELVVEVSDYDISEYPERIAGKQDWYGNAIGIIQDVELWLVDDFYIKAARIYPQKDLKTVECLVDFSSDEECEYKITVLDEEDTVVFEESFSEKKVHFEIPNAKTWSPDDPHLYTLVISFRNGNRGDTYKTRFGIRHIEANSGRIILNGKPLYLFGALDQNFYPDTHYSLRDKIRMLSELTKAKDLGLNLLRYHVKIPDDLYLDIADELGLLVWIDLPYARRLDKISKDYLENLLENVLKRHANHPSFVILSFINESWGVELTDNVDEETRRWISRIYEKARELDSTRLYVDNSACCGNLHIISDINDYHFYFSFPYHNREWEEKISKFSSGEFKTFLTKPKLGIPKVVSEFGIWGLSDPKTWEGEWPDYPICIGGKVFPGSSPRENIKKILAFHDLEDFILQTQLNQFLGLKYQVEYMRLNPEISGYVITEFSDIQWESNGLLDYNRMPKFFYPYMKFLNSKILGIIKDHKALLENPNYHAEIFVSNGSNEAINAELVIRTEKRILKNHTISLKPFGLTFIGKFHFELEKDDQSIVLE